MNQKNIKIILIILVGIIWVMIGYKIFKPSSNQSPTTTQPIKFENNMKQKDTFSLKANYENPFLLKTKKKKTYNRYRSTSSSKNNQNNHQRTNINSPEKNDAVASRSSSNRRTSSKVNNVQTLKPYHDTWPELEYKGVVINLNTSKKSEFIIKANSKNNILSVNDTIEGLVLIYGDNDSIVLKNEKNLKRTYIIVDPSQYKSRLSKSNR